MIFFHYVTANKNLAKIREKKVLLDWLQVLANFLVRGPIKEFFAFWAALQKNQELKITSFHETQVK